MVNVYLEKVVLKFIVVNIRVFGKEIVILKYFVIKK